MTHQPSHTRRSFTDWIDAGFPDRAVVERHYEQFEVPAEDMLRQFVVPDPCADRLPRVVSEAIAEHLGVNRALILSYAAAAFLLLADRVAPDSTPAIVAALFREVTD